MRRLTLLLVLTTACAALWGQPVSKKRPKVAVVLSGGGAKGMAHIGALKVIEKAGIPVDIITGTSMGSIIGGLYAVGYDAHTLDSLVREQDWSFVLSDKVDVSSSSIDNRKKQNVYLLTRDMIFSKRSANIAGIIRGKNLSKLFAQLTSAYRDSIDFNQLPIPFACVATNIVDNTEYDFHHGVLAEAMRTSMAIPGVFSPVRKGNMVLVDGGLRNNYPVDIARRMGADYVIGVTVQGAPKTANDLTNGAAVLSQIVDVNCKNKYDENIANTDVLIKANTTGYSAASFTHAAIDTLIARGEADAMRHWEQLLALKTKLGLPPHYRPTAKNLQHASPLPDRMKLGSISFEGVDASDRNYLERQYRLNRRDSITTADMDEIVNTMRMDLYYDDADVAYQQAGNSYNIHVVANTKKATKLNLGVRFDTEEIVALQANAGFFIKSKSIPMTADFTVRLGKRIMARGDFSIHPYSWGRMMLSYIFQHNDINVNERGDRIFNFTYNQHSVHLNIFDFNIRNFNVTIGPHFDYYNIHNILSNQDIVSGISALHHLHLLSYHAHVTYNSENNWYFPSRGANMEAGYGYYTDDFARYQGHLGFSALNASWRWAFPLNSRLTLQPMLYGRLLFGSDIPGVKQNSIGGDWDSHYFDRQMPFAGMGYVEFTDNQFIALQLKLQQRIADNNYVMLKITGAQHAKKLKGLLDRGPMMGYQASYYYNSMLGPLGASIGFSNKTDQLYFHINLGFVF
uniref:Patatin-like phospholipase family protein n=1 Tax=Prevotella sp. GTC17260 TaxID=3236796 RepID=A0AB33JBG0_9BACT